MVDLPSADHFTFRGNTASGGPAGIWIGPNGINGLIERNVVAGASAALYLAFNPTFTQTIRLNDFRDYSVAVRTSNDFTVPTDIAVDKGNYWGLGCPGFGSGLVFFDNGDAIRTSLMARRTASRWQVCLMPAFLLPANKCCPPGLAWAASIQSGNNVLKDVPNSRPNRARITSHRKTSSREALRLNNLA